MEKIKYIIILLLSISSLKAQDSIAGKSGPLVLATNLVGGYLYTNNTKYNVEFSCTVSNVVANTAGASRTAFWVYIPAGGGLGRTNFIGDYHQAMGATVVYTNLLYGCIKVAPGYIYTATNQSSGSGNDSKIMQGQLTVP